jgi:hypothetical protein
MPKTVTQVKFTVEAGIVSAFKTRCAAHGVSMASVVAQFMETFRQPVKATKIKVDTRTHRKKAVSEYIGLLEHILQMEEQYRDAIPENFEARYESADYSCEQLAQAISYLEDAY